MLAEHLAERTAESPDAFVLLSSQGRRLGCSNFNRRVWQPATWAAGWRACVCTTCVTPPSLLACLVLFRAAEELQYDHRDLDQQRRLLGEVFPERVWELARLLSDPGH